MSTRWRMFGVLATIALVVTACSTAPEPRAPRPPRHRRPQPHPRPHRPPPRRRPRPPRRPRRSTFDWWHITTGDPGKTDFQAIADAYMAAHPNVKINITVLENEAFKTKLATSMQARRRPRPVPVVGRRHDGRSRPTPGAQGHHRDVASWASTINPGALSIYQYNGKQYGIPWDMGIIGFWYNKALFAQAGITAPPTTWDDYLADVDKLKAAGHHPASDRRQGQVAVDAPVDVPRAPHRRRRRPRADGPERRLEHRRLQQGRRRTSSAQRLKPFQDGYKGATYDKRGGGRGQRQGGHGADGPVGAGGPDRPTAPTRRASATTSAGSPSRPSPAARAHATDGVGGGNGIAVGKDAPPEAHRLPEVLHRASTTQNKLNTDGVGLPTTVGTESSVTDPNLQAVLAGRGQRAVHAALPRPGDLAGPGPDHQRRDGGAVRRASTPEKVCQAITDAAATQ